MVHPLYLDDNHSSGSSSDGWSSDSNDLDRLIREHSNEDLTALLSPEGLKIAEKGRERSRYLRNRALRRHEHDDWDWEGSPRPKLFWVVAVMCIVVFLGALWHEESKKGFDEQKQVVPTESLPIDFSNHTTESDSSKDRLPRIERIAILGERHSGTQWLASKMMECFPTLQVTHSLQRLSHWFQTNSTTIQTPTFVLSTFLNPYHWVNAMRLSPLHAPNHTNMDWKTFVTSPWTMPRPQLRQKEQCQYNFEYEEVIPCQKSPDNAVYELDANHKYQPFKTILKLRQAKIENFLSVREWDRVEYFMVVQYEQLQQDDGLAKLLLDIEAMTGLQPSCQVLFGGTEEDYKAEMIIGVNIEDDLRKYLNKHLNWTAEKLIGYEQWDEVPMYVPTASPVAMPTANPVAMPTANPVAMPTAMPSVNDEKSRIETIAPTLSTAKETSVTTSRPSMGRTTAIPILNVTSQPTIVQVSRPSAQNVTTDTP